MIVLWTISFRTTNELVDNKETNSIFINFSDNNSDNSKWIAIRSSFICEQEDKKVKMRE
jgi:hypothetical protein